MTDHDELAWTLVEREQGPDLILFRARYDHCAHPDSGRVLKRIVLESVDWVNMVALTPDGRSVMVRQFRFGVGYSTLETPGGMVDPGEDPLTAAQRELREETGYTGGTWTYLGAVEPNPAFHDHLCHHFLARDVVPSHAQALSGGRGDPRGTHDRDRYTCGRAVRRTPPRAGTLGTRACVPALAAAVRA